MENGVHIVLGKRCRYAWKIASRKMFLRVHHHKRVKHFWGSPRKRRKGDNQGRSKRKKKKEANGGNEKAMQSWWCGGDRWETRMDRKRIKRDDSKEEKWDEATKQDQKRRWHLVCWLS